MATDVKAKSFDLLFDDAVAAARDVLKQRAKGDSLPKESILTLRSVSGIISAWTRYEQTKSARETTRFLMARELTENRDQLKEYLKLTMPSLQLPETASTDKQ